MLEHDHDVGLVPAFLKNNGLEANTIVWYATDNGPEHPSWPHGATTPFRGEKMTPCEGGVRVVSILRWEDAARNPIFHDDESKLMAVRMGPWTWHFSTKKDYDVNVVPRTATM